jgi:hypothetical protein
VSAAWLAEIDYLALSGDGLTPVLVELKTDVASRRAVQDEYLLAAQAAGLPVLLEGVLDLPRCGAPTACTPLRSLD